MTQTKIAEQAIIVGGGMVGLLTARVLSDYFRKVTVIERDLITDENMFKPRVGAPQGMHTHLVMTKGAEILQNMFPKFDEILLAHGAHKVDFLNDAIRHQYGSWKPRLRSEKRIYIQSRPMLEGCVRLLLKEWSNIEFLYQQEAQGILTDPKKTRITGVRLKNTSTHEEQNMYADLIVDASGRNTHFPEWLEGIGYSKPPKSEIKVNINYLSCEFSLPENFNPDWKLLTIYRAAPFKKKSGIMVPLENTTHEKRFLVTLMGQHGEYPVNNYEGFMNFVSQLETSTLYDTIKDAKCLTSTTPFSVPITWRYHYEKLKNIPAGFIAMGDSTCILNPIYAQGISVGAQTVQVLAKLLAENPQNYLKNIQQHFFKRTKKVIDEAWSITTTQDFVYPETEGKRPFGYEVSRIYRNLVIRASNDPVVWKQIFDICNLEKPSNSLFYPSILIRVLPKIFCNK